jgi:2-methylcitrate dehydratase PrpD
VNLQALLRRLSRICRSRMGSTVNAFDHTAQLAFSHNAAAGCLLGLSESQIAHAIAMAASSDASFAVIRTQPGCWPRRALLRSGRSRRSFAGCAAN